MKLWSRGYADDARVVVKATSSAGRLAAPLPRAERGARAAIYMNLARRALSRYAACRAEFADRSARARPRANPPAAVARRRALAPLHAMSIGELAAMSWLAESWTPARSGRTVRGQRRRRSISTTSSPTSPAAWRAYSAISGCPPTPAISRRSGAARCSRAIRRRPNMRTRRRSARRSCATRAATIATRSARAWTGSSASRDAKPRRRVATSAV